MLSDPEGEAGKLGVIAEKGPPLPEGVRPAGDLAKLGPGSLTILRPLAFERGGLLKARMLVLSDESFRAKRERRGIEGEPRMGFEPTTPALRKGASCMT
jgi:hypothetical protein